MKFPEEYRMQLVQPHANRTINKSVLQVMKGLGVDRYRTHPGDPHGAFMVPAHKAPGRRQLNIIACDGADSGWDHVSVSVDNCPKQTPTWAEMCFVKALFWNESEWVMQFHPAASEHVNFHEGCLHMWKPVVEFPKPPQICV